MTSLPWEEMKQAAGDDGTTRVPDGWYDVVVKSAQPGQTSNSNHKVNVRFIVETGPYAGSAVFRDFIITPDKPGGLKMFFRFMGILGVPRERFTADFTLEQLADALVGAKAQIQVGTREWNGQERMDVRDMKALPGSPNTGGGFAFGGDTILPPAMPSSTPVPSIPSVPATPSVPVAPVVVPPMEPVGPVTLSGDTGLPPEPPF